jgi:hypothetical protein
MSEAELHVIRARLQGGLINKARRGELQCSLLVGLVYTIAKPHQQLMAEAPAEVQTGEPKSTSVLRASTCT